MAGADRGEVWEGLGVATRVAGGAESLRLSHSSPHSVRAHCIIWKPHGHIRLGRFEFTILKHGPIQALEMSCNGPSPNQTSLNNIKEDRAWLGWLAGTVASQPVMGLILEDHSQGLTRLHLMEREQSMQLQPNKNERKLYAFDPVNHETKLLFEKSF
jgi:hypothetical protein